MLSPNYATDQTVFVSRPSGEPELRGLYKSVDGGVSWVRTQGSDGVTLLDFVLSPNYATDGTLFLATLEEGLLKSTDGGTTLLPTNLAKAYVTALGAQREDIMVQSRGPGSETGWFTVPESMSGDCGEYPAKEMRDHLASLGFHRIVVRDRRQAGGLCSFRP